MPEYLSPGVYVEEIDAGPKPIEGVSTSTAGAVGVTVRGPTSGKPVLVTSFADFVRTFGGFLPEPDTSLYNKWGLSPDRGQFWKFPLSVKGFFDNGGQRLYVKRVFVGNAKPPSANASASSAPLGQGVIAEVEKDAAAGGTELQLSHLFDLDEGDAVNVVRGDNAQTIGPPGLSVQSYDAASRTITLSAGLAETVKAGRGDRVVVRPLNPPSVAANRTLKFTAKAKGVWGDDISIRVRPVGGASFNVLPELGAKEPFATTLDGDHAAALDTITVTATGAEVQAALADGDRLRIGGKTYTVASLPPPAAPADPGQIRLTETLGVDLDGGMEVTLRRPANVPAFATTLDGDHGAGGPTITVTATGAEVQAALAAGDVLQIDGNDYTVASLPPPAAPTDPGQITLTQPLGADVPDGTDVTRVIPPATDTIRVFGASRLYQGAMVELDNGSAKQILTVGGVSGDTVNLTRTVTIGLLEGDKLRVIEAEVSVRYAPAGAEATVEIFPNLRLVDDGSLSYLVNHVNTRSALASVAIEDAGFSASLFAQFPAATDGTWEDLTGGNDHLEALTVDDFVGKDGGSGNRTGIQALEDIDEVSICMAPGIWSPTVHNALIQHCETLADRFAILDPPQGLDIEGIRAFREPIDTKYAALYYPWIEVRDPSVSRNVIAAPSAHMAGIYARVDVERGVHKAPANEVIRNITKIAQEVTKREQDMLNPRNINVLRFFPGRGNRVWGARVVTSDASWKYINVRRLFIFVEESIDEGTQWVVFEPNDEPLWARVRQSITNFLTTVWRSGALQGLKAEEAFFVKCDRTTMTQDDIDNGRLICLIGIAPVKPAEFVIFRIQQKTLEAAG